VTEPRGLPVDELSHAANVMVTADSPVLLGAVDDSEYTLDIGSATRGNRLVSTSQVGEIYLPVKVSCYLMVLWPRCVTNCALFLVWFLFNCPFFPHILQVRLGWSEKVNFWELTSQYF